MTWWPLIEVLIGVYLGLAALWWNWRYRKVSIELERTRKELRRVCALVDALEPRKRKTTNMHLEDDKTE